MFEDGYHTPIARDSFGDAENAREQFFRQTSRRLKKPEIMQLPGL